MTSPQHCKNDCKRRVLFFEASSTAGFTLLELSIVVVIVGLVIGGVLVGQSLISSAGVQATITQIQKYQTAVNAFDYKYGYLPGDISAKAAAGYGFAARGQYAGEGDGNGVIEGNNSNGAGENNGTYESMGETVMFWVDLSAANLIDGTFNTATSNVYPTFSGGGNLTATSTPSLNAYFPATKQGAGYVYVYSANSVNFFGLTNASLSIQPNGPSYTFPGLTVYQAYSIDAKVDDGYPQTGNVLAQLIFNGIYWAVTSPNTDGVVHGPNAGTASYGAYYTCYDNGGNSANPMQYSMEEHGGTGVNCALSFQFQ
jgi:prepilin-type N-terminal cleavage/methylation domain-containing protein